LTKLPQEINSISNMPRRRKGSKRRSQAPPPVGSPSPCIKDEMSDIQTIPDANDVEELPFHHDYNAQPIYEYRGNVLEMPTELQVRGMAALDQTDP
jgi:hypothetical protein